MEDSPRRIGEDNINQDAELDENPKKRRSPQDFLDRWRRFSSRDTELPHGVLDSNEIEDDEEDDDDDEVTSSQHLNKSAKKRFRRLRGLGLGPYLPQTKEISDSEKRSIVEDSQERESQKDPSIEADKDENYELNDEVYDVPPLTSIEAEQEVIDTYSTLPGDENTQEQLSAELPMVRDPEVVPETESVEDILRRREQNDSIHRSVNREGDVPYQYDSVGSSEVPPTVTETEVIERSIPTGSLLAVDLLNYRIAKKRDNKNKVLNEKQHEQIVKDQKKAEERAEVRFTRLETQQYKQQSTTEKGIHFTEKQSNTTRSNEIYNRSEAVKKPRAVQNPEYIPVSSTSNEKTKEVGNTGPLTSNTPRNFENTLQRVQQAEHGKISSEFQFERRHEVMDEPGAIDSQYTMAAQSHGLDTHSSSVTDSNKHRAQSNNVGTSKALDETKQPVYKQAAITGFWGAVAGIIVFIIMYMLAS